MVIIRLIFAFISIVSFVTLSICQSLIIKRLKELNNGKQSPLISRNGIDINIYNWSYSKFLFIISDEEDLVLKKLKKINLVSLIIFLSFIIATLSLAE
jgi:hypothetical protein